MMTDFSVSDIVERLRAAAAMDDATHQMRAVVQEVASDPLRSSRLFPDTGHDVVPFDDQNYERLMAADRYSA